MIIEDTEECRDELAIRAMQGMLSADDSLLICRTREQIEHDCFLWSKKAFIMAEMMIQFKEKVLPKLDPVEIVPKSAKRKSVKRRY